MRDLPQANMAREQRIDLSPGDSPVRKDGGRDGQFPDDAQSLSLGRLQALKSSGMILEVPSVGITTLKTSAIGSTSNAAD